MQEVLFLHAKEWRAWLRKNHKKESNVALIRYKKHTKKPSFSQRDAMDTAICFGWIDTTVNRIDDEKYAVKFVKRNKNSRWSNATQSYAKRLIKEKRMTPEGLKAYKEGLKKPTIDHNLPKNPLPPEDLIKAFKSKKAEENFNKFSPSAKRVYMYWIEKAVRPETRKKRIKEVAQRAKENKKWGQ